MVEFVDRKGKDKNPRKKQPAMKKPNIQVTCPHCSHAFAVEAKRMGSEVPCPECAKTTRVEAVGEAREEVAEAPAATLMPPRKRAAAPTPFKKTIPTKPQAAADTAQSGQDAGKDVGAGEGEKPPASQAIQEESPSAGDALKTEDSSSGKTALKTKPRCPECGASMDSDAVLCVYCGHDSRAVEEVTKPTMVTDTRKSFPVVPILVACIVAAGAAYYFLVMKKHSPVSSPAPAEMPPDPEVAETLPLELASDPAPGPKPAEPTAPESDAEAVAKETPEPEEASPTSDARQNVIDRLDARQPQVKTGDTVQLAGQDGTIYRGKIIEINDTSVRLYFRGSEGEVPIRGLSPRSRSQVDPGFREQLIDSLVERYQDPGEE